MMGRKIPLRLLKWKPSTTTRGACCGSPYLRQHAQDPVHWLPWCPGAFHRAITECFLLESGGFRALLDPYHQVRGLPDIEAEAHAVYCSHDHFDHGYTERVRLIDGKENPSTLIVASFFQFCKILPPLFRSGRN